MPRADGSVEVGENPGVVTRVVLLRHAVIDTASRLCGSFDVPLAAAGRAQLEAVLRNAPTHPRPDVLYTSTLRRASEVAAELGRAWGLEPHAAAWAREIHCGDVEGVSLDRLRREFPGLWARNLAQDDDTFAWPGGEAYLEFRTRVLAGLAATARAHVGGRIVVVTHAGVISQVLGVIRQRRPAAWQPDRPDPFTATEVTWSDDNLGEILTYNDAQWY